ncbi:hypothetical protein Tco_1543649 [Tanacetum coccineum]
MKRDCEDKDKDEDLLAGSDQGLKKQKTSKDAEPSKGSKSKESNSSSSKGTKSQTKSSGKSAQAEESVFEYADTEMPLNQGSDLGNTDDQPNIKATSRDDWFDELMSTLIDFSAYVMNNLKIENLTQEHLVGPSFNLLKGTCRSRVELEYHFKEWYKAVTDRLDWTNPEGKEYPFDLSKPLPLIEDQGIEDMLYKFCDGTLTYVRTVLHDIASSLRMDYLPKRRWSKLDRRRSCIMIKAIDQQLFERRLMRNLEKFVGGREYGEDFRLLERII